VVLAAAVISQVVVIGGTVWWANHLAQAETGSLPPFPEAAINVYVSDPRWEVAPSMTIYQDEWFLSLLATNIAPTDPGAKAIVVLSGAARLTAPHYTSYGSPPAPFHAVQLPSEETPTAPSTSRVNWGRGASTVPAQVFEVTAPDVYKFHLEGAPQPSLIKLTSTGWSAYVPSIGSTAYTSTVDCHSSATALPDAIAKAVGDTQHSWYKGTCPAWEPGVRLLLGENEHLDRSSLPPNGQTPNDIGWDAHSDATGHYPGRLPEFSVDVANPAIAAKAQQDLLFAGVLYGLAGGLAASWLVAGVTFLVTKAARTRARQTH
jgi:hypothetical protein